MVGQMRNAKRFGQTALVASMLCLGLTACGAGPYGHARQYVPLRAERMAFVGGVELDPVMVERRFESWRKEKVSLWGIVAERRDARPSAGRGQEVVLRLRLTRPEDRNLCANRSARSCRVTVTEHSYGEVYARLRLQDVDDELGVISIGPGSLVRVVGKIVGRMDGQGSVIDVLPDTDDAGQDDAGHGDSGQGEALAPASVPLLAPLVEAGFYRHWPRGYFVTTASGDAMRR